MHVKQSVDVDQVSDNHQDKASGRWMTSTLQRCMAMCGVAAVGLSRYDGCKKLAENPPLNRIARAWY
jgi:hypothetical protein